MALASFVGDLRSGLVTSTIAAITRKHGLPLQVRVYGGPPEKLYEDVSERVVFDVKDGRLASVGPPTTTKLLPPLHGVTTGPELADAIEGSPLRSGWVWIDTRLMSSFELGPRAGLDAADQWNGDRLWDGLLGVRRVGEVAVVRLSGDRGLPSPAGATGGSSSGCAPGVQRAEAAVRGQARPPAELVR